MNPVLGVNKRILVVDDNAAIHSDFNKILSSSKAGSPALLNVEELLYGETKEVVLEPVYCVESAYQGLEALQMVKRSLQQGNPYALAFIDVQMPPGLDGIETIKAIWKEDPELQIALCTAYSDYSWSDVLRSLGVSDNLLILKKPFDNIEVQQIACSQTAKWNINQKRKKTEEWLLKLSDELKLKNAELEADILARKQIEIELVEARVAAENANNVKSSFLANMSHEIRTPINVIMGYNYLIQQTETTGRQKDYASKIDVAATTLIRLINSILDLSKVEAGKIELEHIEFNLREVLSKVEQMTSALISQKGLNLKIDVAPDTPLQLIGDPLRLEQVLLNLTSNAIKFSKSGDVNINVKLLERSKDVTLQFDVRDSGIGMSASGVLRLFQPFVQADATTTRKYGGTGLGLAISKQFVNLMHGEITVQSIPDKGSVFSFSAKFGEPLLTAEESQSQIPLELAKERSQRALVIVPATELRLLLANILADLSFDVTGCASREHSLLEIVRGGSQRPNNFDVLFIDGSESQRDWLTDVVRIREGFSDRVSPKIILVAHESMTKLTIDYSNLGIDSVVFVPLSEASVSDAITLVQCRDAGRMKPLATLKSGTGMAENPLLGTRILLVEDDEINQDIATEILGTVGCEVTIAGSGPTALERIRESIDGPKYHAVLMDIQMPDMNGLDVTRAIRADKRFAALPIIAMTADAIQGVRSQCLESGMDDYLTKPINPDELFATLERWIQISRRSSSRPTEPCTEVSLPAAV